MNAKFQNKYELLVLLLIQLMLFFILYLESTTVNWFELLNSMFKSNISILSNSEFRSIVTTLIISCTIQVMINRRAALFRK